MKLLFKSIKISNFFSLGEANINLDGSGYTLINGINMNPDDLAKSNGSGKSTIFDAIVWCITGDTIRGTNEVVNIHGNDGAFVELEFTADGDNYRLIRTKDHSKYKNSLKIFINDEDKSGKGIRDSAKLLAEYLPDLTASLLGSVIILGQGLPQKFTNNTPSGRKEVLEKLSKSDFMIEDLKTRLNNRKTDLNIVLRNTEDSILEYKSTKQLLQRQIDENNTKLSCLGDNEALDLCISNLTTELNKYKKAAVEFEQKIEANRNEYQKVQAEKATLNEKINSLNEEKTSINTEITNIHNTITKEKFEVSEKWEPIIRSCYEAYTSVTADLKTKTDELKKIQSIKEVCPTCGQKLPGVFKPDTLALENEIANLSITANEKLEAKNKAEADKSLEIGAVPTKYNEQLTVLTNQINAKDSEISEIKLMIVNKYNTRFSQIEFADRELKSTYTKINNSIEDCTNKIENFKLEKESLESKKQAALDIIESNTNQISELDTKIVAKEADLEKLNKHLEIISKMLTVITRDFRGYLLVNIIDFINKKAKEYALDVFETDKIDFKLDGNNIAISYDEKDFSCLSGGEKQKCDLIIQFAIRDMLCKYLGFSSNILVLDEICDNVDAVGAEKLFNMISRKLSDVQNIFIISHHAGDLQIPYDRQITVIKDASKISRIEESM